MRVWLSNLKVPTCSEDINKMHTEFQKRGIFPPSGMHIASIDYIFLTGKCFLYIVTTSNARTLQQK